MLNSIRRLKAGHRDESLDSELLSEQLFIRLLCVERKRTERSGRRFVLMLIDPGSLLNAANSAGMQNLVATLSQATRDTDLKGWYKEGSILGVIFTEVGEAEKAIVDFLSAKVTDVLYSALSASEVNEIKLSFHLFPEDWGYDSPDDPITSTLHTALQGELKKKKPSLFAKRAIDIAGSLFGLALSMPALLLIAAAIKLTSNGPILFRQVRLGQYGRKFTFFKFRSMYTNSDHRIHQDYVMRFIEGEPEVETRSANRPALYKLSADPRVTPLGRILRATSLDELPQFINVLKGEMSLVGPRPPVVYEFDRYRLWHKQRLEAVKPGITGPWQVEGRSRVKFDDMVRLDIRYARSWSIWLDLKILLMTPRAVITGSGAC